MGYTPNVLGHPVLEQTFISNSTGVYPFRVVCFDTTTTFNQVGDTYFPKIKHPNTTAAANETPIGVVTDPISMTSPAPTPSVTAIYTAFNIQASKHITVRTLGVVPILCDPTTDDSSSTDIQPGQWVRCSTTSTYDGCIATSTFSSSVFDPDQHHVGVSYTQVDPSASTGRYALVDLRMVKSKSAT